MKVTLRVKQRIGNLVKAFWEMPVNLCPLLMKEKNYGIIQSQVSVDPLRSIQKDQIILEFRDDMSPGVFKVSPDKNEIQESCCYANKNRLKINQEVEQMKNL